VWTSLDLNRPPIAVGGRRLPKGKYVRPSASVPGLAGFGYLAAQIVADQRQASQVGQRAWSAIALLTFVSVGMIVTALIVGHTSHGAGTNGRCMQSWPIACPGP